MRALDGRFEPRRIDGLQQIIDRVHFERFDGVLIVRRHEDDVRRRLRVDHAPRDFESRQAGHLDVEKHDVGLQPGDRRDGFDAVAGLTDDLDAADLAEQEAQLVARQLLIVHEDGGQP